jgi:hypothetical protein
MLNMRSTKRDKYIALKRILFSFFLMCCVRIRFERQHHLVRKNQKKMKYNKKIDVEWDKHLYWTLSNNVVVRTLNFVKLPILKRTQKKTHHMKFYRKIFKCEVIFNLLYFSFSEGWWWWWWLKCISSSSCPILYL